MTKTSVYACLAMATAGLVSINAQTRQPVSTSGPVPRTPWGRPDLQGRWTSATLTPLERPAELGAKEFFTEEEARVYSKTALERFLKQNNLEAEAAISGEFVEGIWAEDRAIAPTRRTSLIVGPTGRLPPMTTDGMRRAAERAAARQADSKDSAQERPLFERCLWFPVAGPPMIPGIVYNSNYEIVQTPTYVVIHVEMGDHVRIIPTDGRPRVDDGIRFWLGDSRGRWEGDTLVVETGHFTAKTAFRGASEHMRLIERFTRTSADMIRYEFTVDDPATWTAPWSAEIPMVPLGGLLYEFACHEGNRSLEHILRGARADEARRPE